MLLYTSQGECELVSSLEFTFFPIMETCPLLLITQKGQYPLHRGTHLCFLQGFLTMALLTLDCIMLCCGGCPVHCRFLRSIPGYYPLHASSTVYPTTPTIYCHKKMPPDIAKLPLVENHWVIGIKKRKQIRENPGLRI